MKHNTTPMLALAMTAMLALSGCMGAAEDQLGLASEDGDANLEVTLAATNASDDIAHVGAALEGVYAHDAEASSGEGYFNLSLESQRADIVANGETSEVTLASDSVPAGSYDQVMLRTSSVQAHGAAAMGDHGDHGDGGHDDGAEGHDHGSDDGHANGDDGHDNSTEEKTGKENLAVTTDAVDLPVDVEFEIPEGASTEIRITLDVGASTTADTFSPVFEVTVLQDDETQTTTEASLDAELSGEGDSVTETATPPPAARMTVFGPSGDQLYEPSFEVEQDKFVNTFADSLSPGDEIQLGASESEAVADGAALESYEWDFGDGETAEGQSVRHAYDSAGVYGPTLTVTDSNGVTATHRLFVVVAELTAFPIDTSFEEGPGDWTAENGQLTSWSLDGEGHDSETAWHATGEVPNTAYGPQDSAVLRSPAVNLSEDWLTAGYELHVRGQISGTGACIYSLTVDYIVDGEERVNVVTYDTESEPEWTAHGGFQVLEEHLGSEVVFEFTFNSTCDVRTGEGWFVDDVSVGGLPADDMANSELLEQASGGHDHGGHSH